MQQAYQALRIIAEAQTIRIVLAPNPGELMLKELCTACASLKTESSNGIKAVVLDFKDNMIYPTGPGEKADVLNRASTILHDACAEVRAIAQPVLAVVRSTLSPAACILIQAADFTLVAEDAALIIPGREDADETLKGAQAVRIGYITWSAPANDISKQMERILDLLRSKSAVALRYAKAGVRLGQTDHPAHLEVLQQVNTFYLAQVMHTRDAQEGLQAFLEKRKPIWKNM
jgi:enoyl-CoA hydratase/carnithine racemase